MHVEPSDSKRKLQLGQNPELSIIEIDESSSDIVIIESDSDC